METIIKLMKAKLKLTAKQLLSERMLGMTEYYVFPERRRAWGGPFNGQARRAEIFTSVIDQSQPVAILETGTYLGTTTEFMAKCGLAVYTIEGNSRAFGFARARLWWRRNVKMRFGDSRTELRALFEGPLRSVKDKTVFVYLDAHWHADLPLSDELDIVFHNCPAAVVMVDDFQVPHDPGYGYDDYGSGKALTLTYIAPAIASHDLRILYPSTPSSEEGGARRGCIVLMKKSIHSDALASWRGLTYKTQPSMTV